MLTSTYGIFRRKTEIDFHRNFHPNGGGRKKRGNRFPDSLSKGFGFLRNLLVEVTLQHTLQSLTVTGLVQ